MVSARGVLRHEGFPYALDNGAWTAFQEGKPFDAERFRKAIDLMGAGADFIVVPDIVCGGLASLDFSLSWMDELRPLGVPLLVPVQNGMTTDDMESVIGSSVGVFVGGDDAWKEGTMRQWGAWCVEREAYCHVGRVNTRRRVMLVLGSGAHSFDGSGVSRFAVTVDPLSDACEQADWTSPRRYGY